MKTPWNATPPLSLRFCCLLLLWKGATGGNERGESTDMDSNERYMESLSYCKRKWFIWYFVILINSFYPRLVHGEPFFSLLKEERLACMASIFNRWRYLWALPQTLKYLQKPLLSYVGMITRTGVLSAPHRVKFFAWLLVNDKLHRKANLLRKTLVDNAACEVCNNSGEDANHPSSSTTPLLAPSSTLGYAWPTTPLVRPGDQLQHLPAALYVASLES